MKRPQSRGSLQLRRRQEKSRGLSAITRSDKSIPALGGGMQHPGQQAAGLPGERGRMPGREGARGGREEGDGREGRLWLPPVYRGASRADARITRHQFRAPCHLPPRDPQQTPARGLGSEGTFTSAIIPLGRS